MVRLFYTLDYLDVGEPTISSKDSYEDKLIDSTKLDLHAYMYALGEKYQITALKDLATSYTAELLQLEKPLMTCDEFVAGAEIVWSTTPDLDRGLSSLHREVPREIPGGWWRFLRGRKLTS